MPDFAIDKVTPGMHRQFVIERFTEHEQRILHKLAHEWYLTNSGQHIRIAASSYDYFLMKPTQAFAEMFNLERELIVVFSPYETFEPRTLDAFDQAERQLSDLRTETVCKVLISKDILVESKIEALLKTDPEQPIVVPFNYGELLSPYGEFFLRNRFRKHFYTRDLFSFLSPLKKDLYFFGRSELIQDIVNRHRSGEHTGLFGLRKSGKTSIIYAIERHLEMKHEQFLSIDCENPSIHKLRWNELLQKLVGQYREVRESKYRIPLGNRYDEKNASDSFSADIMGIYRSTGFAPVLILLDEIERISPYTGSSPHWREGEDFVYFWQTLRGFFQRNPGIFTYMIVGTNPSCVELPTIAGHENPLFSSIPSQYVPSFTIDQVRQMVRKLGRFMGLQFDEIIYGKLTEDFAGHPFLIRQICSEINKACIGERPARVDRALYDKVKRQFTIELAEYYEMILQVLQQWYPEEYDMLCFLARGDTDTFAQFAQDNQRYTKHLVGYGLVQQSSNGYSFSLEAVRDFLSKKHKYEKLNLTQEEKLAEISSRRNRIEKGLRSVFKNALIAAYGRKKAGQAVVSAIPEERRTKLPSNDLEVLLNKDSTVLFFLDLIQMCKREWNIFKNIFEMEQERLVIILSDINSYGRPDAHAKTISEEQFTQLRLHFKQIEAILADWEK